MDFDYFPFEVLLLYLGYFVLLYIIIHFAESITGKKERLLKNDERGED